MRHLCDSNVLLAAVVGSHPHHTRARTWMESLEGENRIILCRTTQASLLRLLTTEAVLREDVRTNSQAIAILEALMKYPQCDFATEEPLNLQADWFRLAGVRSASPKIWMDTYLVAFALGFSMRMVTFDRGFRRFEKEKLDLLLLE